MSTFVCAVCHLEYRSDPSFTLEARIAEYEATHGKPFPGENSGVGTVCDECYPRVIEWARKKGMLP